MTGCARSSPSCSPGRSPGERAASPRGVVPDAGGRPVRADPSAGLASPEATRCRPGRPSEPPRWRCPRTRARPGSPGSSSSGLDYGPRRPLRFVVPGDLHLALRRDLPAPDPRLPPTDGIGVTPAAAFVAYCAKARVIDAIKVGDWLLHHEHLALVEARDLALAQLWRDGAARDGLGPRPSRWTIPFADGVRDPGAPALLRAPTAGGQRRRRSGGERVDRRPGVPTSGAWSSSTKVSTTRRTATSTSST